MIIDKTFADDLVGTMDCDNPTLSVSVVPDSGTGELTELSGAMLIDVSAAGRRYTFDYTLPTTDR